MEGTVFTQYCGKEEEVSVDVSESGEAYSGIAAKAFLSCKTIKKLKIGSSVAHIGDWAFAHMQNLEELVLPNREIAFGKKVFLNCNKLTRITIQDDRSQNLGLSYFLAAAVGILQKEELLQIREAGSESGHANWMKAYDDALFRYLEEADETGFNPVFFGWFKVEDIDDQMPVFLREKRRNKARMILLRLLYPVHLSEENRDKLSVCLKEYLPEQQKEKTHTAVYDLFCEADSCYAKDVRYLQILKDCGCLSGYLIQLLLENMKEATAEARGYLLREESAGKEDGDFFADFIL